jgi:hypothetical protein
VKVHFTAAVAVRHFHVPSYKKSRRCRHVCIIARRALWPVASLRHIFLFTFHTRFAFNHMRLVLLQHAQIPFCYPSFPVLTVTMTSWPQPATFLITSVSPPSGGHFIALRSPCPWLSWRQQLQIMSYYPHFAVSLLTVAIITSDSVLLSCLHRVFICHAYGNLRQCIECITEYTALQFLKTLAASCVFITVFWRVLGFLGDAQRQKAFYSPNVTISFITFKRGSSTASEAEDFSPNLCVQTGSGAHPASCTVGTGGSFPGGKRRPGRDADHSPPSSAEVKKE